MDALARLRLGADHQSLVITATMRSGLCVDEPYGLDLAGLISSRLRRIQGSRLRPDDDPLPDTNNAEVDDLALPFAHCVGDGDENWHWLASCAILRHVTARPESHVFYRNVDARYASDHAAGPIPSAVMHHTGAWRDQMLPTPVSVCSTVVWHAVGDADQLRRLLTPIRYLGKRRATGEGRVLAWDIADIDADPYEHAHLADGNIIRPCPVECLDGLGYEVPHDLGWYAIRPPSWHPNRLVRTAMTASSEPVYV